MQVGGVVAAMLLTLGGVAPASAEGLGPTKATRASGSALFASQTRVLDGRAAQQYEHSVRYRPDFSSVDSGIAVIPSYAGRYKGQYLATARAAAQRHGVPADLFLRLVQQESGWNPAAVSPKGALGLAQLMPETAARLGVDPTVPEQNLEGGARYLRMMYDRFGNWRHALAAYNAGPEAVSKHGGIPPYQETTNYVKVILGG